VRRRDEVARRAIEALQKTRQEISKATGASVDALYSYRSGRRSMPDDVRRRFARYLRRQASDLEKLADRLEEPSE
jgi:hypothetical protein